MKIRSLDKSEIDFINTSLLKNGGIGNSEFKVFSKNHPYVVGKYKDIDIIGCTKEYYGTHDLEFNNFLISKFGDGDWVLDSFYKLTYNVGDSSIPHFDFANKQTTIILLSDDFTGGESIIDNVDINMNKTGTFVRFLGSKLKHGVNPVISGKREVLVVWFNSKQTII